MQSTEYQTPNSETRWRAELARTDGKMHAFYEAVHAIGIELRTLRWQHFRSVEEVAQQLGISPQMVGYMEIGWITPDEFLRLIDVWAGILGQDGEVYRQRIPSQF